MTDLNPPLLPRDGAVLQIVAVCRISTPHQDKRSLDDQLAKLKQFVADHYDGPVEWTLISSQGSGEHLLIGCALEDGLCSEPSSDCGSPICFQIGESSRPCSGP